MQRLILLISVTFWGITGERIGAKTKGEQIWDQEGSLYQTTKYHHLAPPYKGSYYM